MHKNGLLLTAFLTTTLATGLVVVPLIDCARELFALAIPWSEEQAVDAKLASYRCFKESMESIQQAVEFGDIRLEDASRQVIRAALQHCPEYLSKLSLVERGDSDDERVARNLVRYVRVEAIHKERPPSAARLQALDIELLELLREMH